jgi:alpha-1,2-mannosyltransferase
MRWFRPLELLLFVAAPLASLARHSWFVDGNGGAKVYWVFRSAGSKVSMGDSPYRAATVHVIGHGSSYVYSEPFAYLFVPFTWVPYRYGAVAFMLLSAIAVVLAIRLLGARDWRVYGAAMLTYPVFAALELGAIGPLLLLFVAAGWRYRDRAAGGVFLALAAAVKLFLWPLLVWLVVTRRLRGSLAAGATLVAVLGIWALTDRSGLGEYPALLRVLNQVFRRGSYSPQALSLSLGAAPAAAAAVSIVIAALGVAVIVALRRSERDAFAAAVIVALLATPILWMHYLVLLMVPLVLLNPSLSVWWLALIPLWATPQYASHGDRWRLLLTLAVVAVIASAPLWRRSRQPEPTDHAALA